MVYSNVSVPAVDPKDLPSISTFIVIVVPAKAGIQTLLINPGFRVAPASA